MKKKKMVLFSGVAIAALTIIGTSLAWFTAEDSLVNHLQVGKVDIELKEELYGQKEDENGIYNEVLVPGEYVLKDLSIALVPESQEAYVRMKRPRVVFVGMDERDNDIQSDLLDGQLLIQGGNSNFDASLAKDWIEIGDYFYYKNPVGVNDRIYFLEEKLNPDKEKYTLRIPFELGNEVQGAKITILYEVEAIQAKNVDVDFTSEQPWPQTEIYKYEKQSDI